MFRSALLNTKLVKFEAFDTQLDLLEKLNLRRNELEQWKREYPSHCQSIEDVSVHVGQVIEWIKNWDPTSRTKLHGLLRQYDTFILDYEALWLLIR